MQELLEVKNWLRRCSLESASDYGEYVYAQESREIARRKGLALQVFAIRSSDYQWLRYFLSGENQVFACQVWEANLLI